MAVQTVNVEITPTGEVLVDIHGYQGKGCDAVLQAIAGKNTIKTQTNKPEYLLQQFNLVKK